MKPRLLATVLSLTMILSAFSGCTVQKDTTNTEVSSQNTEQTEVVEEAKEEPVPASELAKPIVPSEDQSEPLPAEESQKELTGEDAEAIALEHAKLTAADVKRLYSEYEIDDGIPHFDVQFDTDKLEYEYEIHAETGDILSYEQDDLYD